MPKKTPGPENFPIRPLGCALIVEKIKAPDMTPGGIALPSNTRNKITRAKVIAVGPGERKKEDNAQGEPQYYGMCVKPGAVVHYTPDRGHEFDFEVGRPLVYLLERDLLGEMT